MGANIEGRYAYQFWGFDNGDGGANFLVGVGLLKLAEGGVSGRHRSALMPLAVGAGREGDKIPEGLFPASFELSGTYKLDDDGIWSVDVEFVCRHPEQRMRSRFAMVDAGQGRLWLASQGSHIREEDGRYQSVAESALGEALRVVAGKARSASVDRKAEPQVRRRV